MFKLSIMKVPIIFVQLFALFDKLDNKETDRNNEKLVHILS